MIKMRRHREAFQAYKKFAFLKKGLNPIEYKTKTEPSEESKLYFKHYPQPDELLRAMFSDNNYAKVLWKEDPNHPSVNAPGRSFKKKFTHLEMLERYLGDDLMRIPELDTPENKNIFGYNEDASKLFPALSLTQRRRQQ